MKVSVIFPTYNERDHIVKLVNDTVRILKNENLDGEIIIVDDNSPDNTAEIIEKEFKTSPVVKLFIRKDGRGLATAIKRGIRESQGDIVVIMDTDFNHNPEMIPLFVYMSKHFDISIGSRYVVGGGMLTSQFRYYLSYAYNLFIRTILVMGTKDNLSGFLGIKREVFKDMDLDKIFYGYGDYCMRFLYYAKKMNYKIIEVPVVYNLRLSGESKTNFFKHTVDYTISVLKLRLFGIK